MNGDTGAEHADEPALRAALAPDSIRTGAVISYDGDAGVVGGPSIIDAIESRLTNRASRIESRDQWLLDGVPVLARGDAWIVPLFSSPPVAEIGSTAHETLAVRATELGESIRHYGDYLHGYPLYIDLPAAPAGGRDYASELTRTGARRPGWWASEDSAMVLVYYGGPSPAPTTRMAMHVVPLGWVSERRPIKAKKMPLLNLDWSWADVVDFAGAHGH